MAHLAASRRLLVQAATASHPSGWEVEAAPFRLRKSETVVDGFRVLSIGSRPWMIANTLVSVAIRNPHLARATLLDSSGHPHRQAPLSRDSGSLHMKLPTEAMYVLLTP